MSQYFFNPAPTSSMPQHHGAYGNSHSAHHNHHNQHNHHHGGRSRRSNRYSTSQNSHKHMKNNRGQKEAAEAAQIAAIRKDFEAARSFDLEDDEVFCPWHLLTEDDLQSIHSASSDRSSSAAGDSPSSSPLQQQLQPTPAFAMPQHHHNNPPSAFQPQATGHLKLHQPLAQRARNPIPIVDPNSRTTSPPDSVSPARQAQKPFLNRRW